MLYGEGYVAEVVLQSDLIELGGRKTLVSIAWDTDTPPGTWVEISTRTGNELVEQRIYHDSDGSIVSEDRYTRRLPRQKQGAVTSVFLPGEDWSPWSRPYRYSGEEIQSPRIRKYLQLQARVLADTSSKYGRPASLRAIRVELDDLYADQLVGEVWPCQVDSIGQPEERSYFIRPFFSNDAQGFDEIQLVATAATTMELVEVRTGTQEDFRQGTFQRFPASQVDLVRTGNDTLCFRLPELIRAGRELVEVRYRPTIYANSAAFQAMVKTAGSAGSWQQVDVGDATTRAPSQTNVVVAVQGNKVLTDLRLEPPVITPNRDRVNDLMTFSFSVNRLHLEKEIVLSIYDLSGRCVCQLSERRPDPRGRYSLVWDGQDQTGATVPPGTYLARIELEAESGRAEQPSLSRLIRVAY